MASAAAASLKHSLDDNEHNQDIQKRRRIWVDYIGAVAELVHATRDVYQLIQVLDKVQWPEDKQWMESNPVLAGLYEAHVDYKEYPERYVTVNRDGVSAFFERHERYLTFVRSVLAAGTGTTFDFIRQRGVDFTEFVESAFNAAIRGTSAECLRKLHEMFPQQFEEYKRKTNPLSGDVLQYMYDTFETKEAKEHLLVKAVPIWKFSDASYDDLTIAAAKLGRPLDIAIAEKVHIDWIKKAHAAGVQLPVVFVQRVIQLAVAQTAIWFEIEAKLTEMVAISGPLPDFRPISLWSYAWARRLFQWQPSDKDALFSEVVHSADPDWAVAVIADGFMPTSAVYQVFHVTLRNFWLLKLRHKKDLRRILRLVLKAKSCIDPVVYQNEDYKRVLPKMFALLPPAPDAVVPMAVDDDTEPGAQPKSP